MSKLLLHACRVGCVVGILLLAVSGMSCGGSGAGGTGVTPDEIIKLRSSIMFGEHAKVSSMLANRPALANITFDDGSYPLHEAASGDQTAIVKALMEEGAEKNALNSKGETPLQVAVTKGNVDVVKALVQAGADINMHGGETLSPLAIAKAGEHEKIVEFLKSYNAKE